MAHAFNPGMLHVPAVKRPAHGIARGATASLLPQATPPKEGDYVDIFCRGTNSLMKQLVLKSFRDKVEMQPAGSAGPEVLDRLLAPPEYPGMSRPLWLVMAGSIPTLLGWYGYYKFSVEEELFQDELATDGRVTGCGGYGTLFPFVFLGLIGALLRFVFEIEAGEYVIEAGGVWILGGQINLYRRINQLYEKDGQEAPLHAWWAALPPPFDLVVGLRQVHFLARYWATRRGDDWNGDKIAEEYFPFVSSPRFTLKEFARTPSNWFWFTKEAKDFDFPFLKEASKEMSKEMSNEMSQETSK
eukprot:CAMPEP_0179443326 /NCGR_PEP_ID=MMETSP0799-20121207/26760_1 /TAXON_ID=46947 /ORGANISM="Geminigera cryophila, Strain CCMP2564" /LENGTH=299 /DNA_ID=CAMNT_0021229233 /DNA_START=33 /DNA_END=932 /DNA_ORIENTATION=+